MSKKKSYMTLVGCNYLANHASHAVKIVLLVCVSLTMVPVVNLQCSFPVIDYFKSPLWKHL